MNDACDADFFQTYLYRFPINECLQVLFMDGRLFYELNHQHEQIRHMCGGDLYLGEFNFDNPETWHQIWRVKGPRKDYQIETIFMRSFPN